MMYINYFLFLITMIKFNMHYRSFYRADIGMFANCSWADYKRVKKKDYLK
jgi:hypothetical protein